MRKAELPRIHYFDKTVNHSDDLRILCGTFPIQLAVRLNWFAVSLMSEITAKSLAVFKTHARLVKRQGYLRFLLVMIKPEVSY